MKKFTEKPAPKAPEFVKIHILYTNMGFLAPRGVWRSKREGGGVWDLLQECVKNGPKNFGDGQGYGFELAACDLCPSFSGQAEAQMYG